MVLKPAEQTPFSALALGRLAQEAGIPSGVLNIIPTSTPQIVGTALTQHPQVRKLSFTGSTRVGKQLLAACASTVKKVSLELGGNAPFIVFSDADLDAAVEGVLTAKYRNTGQTCVCANRIVVQDTVYEAVVHRLAERVARLRVGPGADPQTQQGPLINAAALQKVESHVFDALDKGAHCLVGGKRHALGGYFFEPTVLAHVSTSMKICHEETFGPVAPVLSFRTEEEAIALANDTPLGLASYVYTQHLGRAFRVGEALECGMVGLNEARISTAQAPFGGIKESGLGREGAHDGLEEYLHTKYWCVGLPSTE